MPVATATGSANLATGIHVDHLGAYLADATLMVGADQPPGDT